MTALRTAAQQALEAMLNFPDDISDAMFESITALKAALAQKHDPVAHSGWVLREVLFDNGEPIGHREPQHSPAALAQQAEPLNLADPAVQKRLASQWGYVPAAAQAEPVEPVAWDVTKNGRLIYDYDFTHDVSLRVMGDFEDDEQRVRYAKQIVDKLNAIPPQRTMVPLTEGEILAAVGWERAEMYMKLTPNFPVDEAKKETLKNARAIEKASWEKNHGQA